MKYRTIGVYRKSEGRAVDRHARNKAICCGFGLSSAGGRWHTSGVVDDQPEPVAGGPWTAAERAAAIALYLRMLSMHIRGEVPRQTELFAAFAAEYPARTAKSIGNKIYNISACFAALDLPYLENLTPRFNFQRQLLVDVQRAASENVDLLDELARLPSRRLGTAQLEMTGDVVVDPPKLTASAETFMGRARIQRGPIDYIGREQANAALGLAGEEWVVAYERRRLAEAGRADLAKEVRHVSVVDGDGAGYDVRSFDPRSERQRLIEVKTTRSGILTPFYLTRNEVEVSKAAPESFSLYRVHCFGLRTRVYWLDGSLDRTCDLAAMSFRALPKAQSA